ncbi:hypothetical protein C8F04DRAFT_966886 [Mycena alexandri]|uniref:Protein kinase domain-containing protein n=1 Tax=Mycena alexandri TaxID=1745969 RepID=A0AAD6SEM1_9AGAR|nr:hypothetical protein C8F04DRAFT_966886 [Mycena alexandri]
MSTLQLIWDSQTTYQMWSWNQAYGKTHHTAQLVRRVKKDVYTVRIGLRGMDPTDVVAIKVAHGKEALEEMEREAGFYEHQLKSLQGTVVPKLYGFYTTRVNGTPLGCLLLEYCSGPPVGRERIAEMNRKALHAAYALHDAGVLHGDLLSAHHFVPMGRDIRIVDFGVAVTHQCVNGLARRAAGHGFHHVCGCPELAALEDAYAHDRR